ncbi:AAA family ATPase [Leucothrix mucor]|uniref:AAA family ATPase n=1 Tax=Leucothrix mucor TaxID=45248 RepID=UPI0003B5CE71|nr:AAA family ATPase [Leucothrix mucor]
MISLNKLASYVESYRPIIYMESFDFSSVDKMILEVSEGAKIYEYNDAGGNVDFETKHSIDDYSINEFLSLFDNVKEGHTVIVLKDIHEHLGDLKTIALLKAIALKTINLEGYEVTIFIVSTKLVVPVELEKLITVFDIPFPTVTDISKVILNYAEDMETIIDSKLVADLSVLLKGFTEFEIVQILNLAFHNSGSIQEEDKKLILEEKEQIIKKTGLLEILNFKETVSDIGGLENLKKWLENKSYIYSKLEEATKFGVDVPNGIMIVGMPGCGKSLTAKATANLFQVPLVKLDVGKLLGKYVGESEANLRRAINIAEAISPCVLWIDELEKAFAGVGSSGSGNDVTTRLFGHFLTWLQDKESSVFVVATSNDISNLPPEFLRKGRFDEIFFVDFPNAEERRKIFEIHLKKRKKMNVKIDTTELMQKTDKYSGADIESVIKESIEKAFINGEKELTTSDLVKEINDTTPISVSLKDKISKARDSLKSLDIKNASK